jgi:hypothetical protein
MDMMSRFLGSRFLFVRSRSSKSIIHHPQFHHHNGKAVTIDTFDRQAKRLGVDPYAGGTYHQRFADQRFTGTSKFRAPALGRSRGDPGEETLPWQK